MKKLTSFTLALLIALACFLPTVSLAAGEQSFTISINCVSENDALTYVPASLMCQTSNHRMRVSHSSSETSNSYTNLFHATKCQNLNSITGVLCGQKWCTPNLTVNIASNAIVAGNYYYGLAVRGNTKYNEYEDLTSFTISGSYKPF